MNIYKDSYTQPELNYFNSTGADSATKIKLMTELLDSLGFSYKSNNKNIHLQIREVEFNLDIWPTTDKLQLSLFGETIIFTGVEKVLNVLIVFA